MIAIIAILAAILFPVFARARENARRSSCQSNLKQIALGIKQYIHDYDAKYPLAVTGGGSTIGWGDATQPYLKSDQIFQCPSEPNAPAANPNNNGYSDYFYNAALSWNGDISNQQYNRGVKEAALEFSSLTILNGDFRDAGSGAGGTATTRSTGRSTNSSNNRTDFPGATGANPETVSDIGGGAQTHLEGINLSFADGHVKWVKCADANTCDTIYQMRTPFSVSKQSPTFHVSD